MKAFLIFTLISIGVGASLISGSALGAYLYAQNQDIAALGATTARTTITNPWTFSATTTMSKPLILTTTNSATSTTQVGCIQMTATSTASPIKLVPVATATTTTTFGYGTTGFIMVGVFGTCPNLP